MNGLTNHVLMVRPHFFMKNDQTAANNYFQNNISLTSEQINKLALEEFDEFVNKLIDAGINITLIQDSKFPITPDSIFPNNWVSFHKKNKIILYSMYAANRRNERNIPIFEKLRDTGAKIEIIHDYTNYEKNNLFLEGTGSMVLDRVNKKCYASLSERTNKELVIDFCNKMHYKPIFFRAYQTFNGKRLSIYHTNVMMSIGNKFAVVGIDSIDNEIEKQNVINELTSDGKEIISLSELQIQNFAGNMLLLKNSKTPVLVMSSSAFDSLTNIQKLSLQNHSKIIHANLNTIEQIGGGSARCMLTEVF